MRINIEQCMGCGNCLKACPRNLLKISGNRNQKGLHYLENTDPERCVNCGQCELMCTADAIAVKTEPSPLHDMSVIPEHAGCNFGTLRKVFTDVITKLGIEKDIVIFTIKGSYLGLTVDFREYDPKEDSSYADAIAYKKEHPEKIVVVICPCGKENQIEKSRQRFLELRNEQIVVIHAFLHFAANEDFTALTGGGNSIPEEVSELGYAGFVARGNLRTPANVRQFEGFLEKAIRNEQEGKPFSLLELDAPCYFRLKKRPSAMLEEPDITQVNEWFERHVIPAYPNTVIRE